MASCDPVGDRAVSHIGDCDELSAQLVTELVSSDVDGSVSFYQSLGFELDRRTERFAALRWGDRYLFVTAGQPASGGELPNIRIIVGDVDREYRRAIARGLNTDGPPQTQAYGLRDFTLFDPDNYGVRFAQVQHQSPA